MTDTPCFIVEEFISKLTHLPLAFSHNFSTTSKVMIYDYNTKLTAEENYADSDIVLIFFSANLKDNDSYQQAVKVRL